MSSRRAEVLTQRRLGRATLARQMLLERVKVPVPKAVERLAGMQAQQARPPFVGLWTRLEGFAREDLVRAIAEREVVRATMMRVTLHLVSAADYCAFRAALQPALTQGMQGALRDAWKTLDVGAAVAVGREHFASPRSFDALRTA